jgi:HSP20 family protein
MNITYPIHPYGLTANRLFNLADALLGDRNGSESTAWVPPVDVVETEHQYELAAELPGVNPSDVKVVVKDNVLTLSGERPALPAAEGSKSHVSERRFGAFQRRFSLPKDADGERVSASFKAGILHIAVPKRDEVKPREIEIKVD